MSCEETGLTDFPYVERLVVGCVLDAGSDNVLVLFGKTLPLDEPYDPSKASLRGVAGHIVHSGVTYPLSEALPGLYVASGLHIASGEAYDLEAEWQGKHVRAHTRIPFPPTVVSCTAHSDMGGSGPLTLETVVRAAPSDAYGQTWTTTSPSGSSSGGAFTEIKRAVDADANGDVKISEAYDLSVAPADTLFGVVHALDEPFYDFFISKGGNTPGYDDLLFREIGGFVNWNVEGDGIGLFIGRATTRIRADLE
jgi:hypothetical protein